MAKFHKLDYELLPHPHPPYSPDLAPCNNLKNWVGAMKFVSNNDIIAQTNDFSEVTWDKEYKDQRKVCWKIKFVFSEKKNYPLYKVMHILTIHVALIFNSII